MNRLLRLLGAISLCTTVACAAPYSGEKCEYTRSVTGELKETTEAVIKKLEANGFRILAFSEKNGVLWGQKPDLGMEKGDIFVFFKEAEGRTQIRCQVTEGFFLSREKFSELCESL